MKAKIILMISLQVTAIVQYEKDEEEAMEVVARIK